MFCRLSCIEGSVVARDNTKYCVRFWAHSSVEAQNLAQRLADVFTVATCIAGNTVTAYATARSRHAVYMYAQGYLLGAQDAQDVHGA